MPRVTKNGLRMVAVAVGTQVVLPIGVYLLLVHLGVRPVWALVASAGVSVVGLVVQWVRTREISTLGLIVAGQFVVGIVVALVTADPRFVLLKDWVITLLIALGAAASLRLRRPLIARVQRELSPDRADFDRRWSSQPEFRRVHRRLTVVWVAGLVVLVAIAVLLIYRTPLTVAVVSTNVLSPVGLAVLIGVTEVRVARVPDEPGRDHDRRRASENR